MDFKFCSIQIYMCIRIYLILGYKRNDLIAINFGVVRSASGEQWHFEFTDLRVSNSEQELVEHENR